MGGADASAAPLRPPQRRRSTHPREAARCPVGSARGDRARRRRRDGEGNKPSRSRFCDRVSARDIRCRGRRVAPHASTSGRSDARPLQRTRRRRALRQRRRPRDDKRQPRCANRCYDAPLQALSGFPGNRILGGPDERVGTPPWTLFRVAHGPDRQAPLYGGSGD